MPCFPFREGLLGVLPNPPSGSGTPPAPLWPVTHLVSRGRRETENTAVSRQSQRVWASGFSVWSCTFRNFVIASVAALVTGSNNQTRKTLSHNQKVDFLTWPKECVLPEPGILVVVIQANPVLMFQVKGHFLFSRSVL